MLYVEYIILSNYHYISMYIGRLYKKQTKITKTNGRSF